MRGGVYNGPNGEQLYGDGSEVEPMTVAKPITEHPAVRAAREIAHRFVGIVESPSRRSSWWRVNLKGNSTYTPYYGAQWEKANDVCENLRSVVADAVMESLRAYAERDARVLEALRGVPALIEEFGCLQGAATAVRAAISELEGE